MRFTEFVRKQFSESDGTPSNNRIILFLLITTTMLLVLGVVFAPVIKPGLVLKLPDVPDSFANLIEWLTTVLVCGVAVGKGVNAYQATNTKGSSSSTSVQKTEVIKNEAQ